MGKMRVVIADDQHRARMFVATSLRNGGHDVVAMAANGKEAVAFCRKTKPDLALLDISMPGMNGIEAAQAIVAEGLAANVLIVSSNMQGGLDKQARAVGAKVIGKTNGGHDLLAKIAQAFPDL